MVRNWLRRFKNTRRLIVNENMVMFLYTIASGASNSEVKKNINIWMKQLIDVLMKS
jgi:hypothetical protein